MAEVTPRILYDDYFERLVTVVTPSSFDNSFPIDNILDPTRAIAWRSKLGWNVIVNWNTKIIFAEAGVERTGTLAAGNDSTGAAYATRLQTAMNGAPGKVNTYGVTYSSSTNKITITRTAGTAAVELRFRTTDTEYAHSAHPDAGFTDGLKSGATTYVSEGATRRSREYLHLDPFVGGTQTLVAFRAAALAGTNLPASSVTVIGSSSQRPWEDKDFTATLDSLHEDRLVDFFASNQTWAYWAFILGDVAGLDGFAEVPIAFLGPVLEPSRGIRHGFTERTEDPSIVTISESGAKYQDGRTRGRGFRVEWWRLPEAQKELVRAFAVAKGVGGHFWLALDPQNGEASKTFYGTLAEEVGYIHHVGDGNPPSNYDTSVAFSEEVA